MPLFEQNPLLLIPIVVLIIEGWAALKPYLFAKARTWRR